MDLHAPVRGGGDLEGRPDQDRPLAHAGQPAGLSRHRLRQAAAVIRDGERDALRGGPERHTHLGGSGVAQGVGERLLGHAIDHQLDLRAERWQASFELTQHPHGALTLHAQAQRDQRVDEPQVVERLRAQLAGDAANVVEAAVDRVDDLS